ncbi:30S ribosomal protein S20 [Chlamydia avium]|uniref:Small ribosomal subunit protein bS20 n=2 Tax=Chlamydia avium TaxID=1457141 RepID=W8JMW8_9CHLA|nr:30S ribosomal protein S20 [Chlamydia avium]AHK63639.1 30S ribosomal protein S20 [Chlamydia avium 10DC88]EPP36216.1 ribosomal protein S20 [Chlamydia psittaci 10_743_SC13]EPP38470.1 ribosomal protein S20 [Chlamydia avium]VVT43224.1 30S ribosomal protein S20 [Chlamydia avium]
MATKKTTKKNDPKKRSSAEKRVLTSQKRARINQSFKSKVKTLIKKFEQALKEGDQENITTGLRLVYSMADRAVKRGIFKANKAARIKSHATKRANINI